MTEGVTVTGDKNYGPAKSGNFEKITEIAKKYCDLIKG